MSKEQEADREKLEDESLAASEEASSEISADGREPAPADQPESDGAADAAPGDDSVSGSAGQDDSSSSGAVADDGVDADDPALTGNSAQEESAPNEAGALEESAPNESGAPEESSVPAAQDEAGGVQVRGESGTEEAKAPAKEEAAEEEPPREMTFTEHLNELRVRLVRCLIAVFIGFLACYGFAEQLFMLLMEPLITLLEPSGGSLIYTGLPEAFFTHLKVAALAGLFVASPYVFYQIWMFIAPGLYEGERKYMIPIALCSALCFVTGALFGYFVVFPYGFQFFLGYASEAIQPMPSVKEYFSFSTSMLFAFGLIFELPLFMLFLSVLGIVNYKTLRKYRKFAILGNFVVAAILTPPDVVSQTLMAGPMCLLYEVGIWVSYMFGKKPKEEPPEEEAEASQAKA